MTSIIKHHIQRFIYRLFRKLSKYFLFHPNAALAKPFFKFVQLADAGLSNRHISPYKELENKLWKVAYFRKYEQQRPFQVQTMAKIAAQSDDYKWPRGAIYNNSTNRQFNLKAYNYFGYKPSLSLLDLGCSGGGLVKSFIEDGFTAVGLEGSDLSQKLRSGEWDTIPYHLFTCDITEPFEISDADNQRVKFDVITAWEVLEHIPTEKITLLLANIKRHLAPNGIFVGSVAQFPDGNPLTRAVYHVTLQPKSWWLMQFASIGLEEEKKHPFEARDYVRGHGLGLKDWDPHDGDGFHLIMKHSS